MRPRLSLQMVAAAAVVVLQHYYCVPVASGDAVYVQEIDVDSFANLGIDDSIDELWLLSFYSSRSVALSSYTLSLPIAPLSSALVPQQLRRVRGVARDTYLFLLLPTHLY